MRCPRCETAIDADAVRCARCGAPLQFADEPSPARLDVDLQLDRRRRSATPVPASVAADQASRGEHDLGDLSFDPPADDGWTFGDPNALRAEAGDELAEDAEAETAAEDEDDGELGADAEAGDDLEDERGDDAPADGELRVASDDSDDAEGAEGAEGADDADEVPRGAEPSGDQPAVRRGRVLSLASIAIAAAVLVVALLTSR